MTGPRKLRFKDIAGTAFAFGRQNVFIAAILQISLSFYPFYNLEQNLANETYPQDDQKHIDGFGFLGFFFLSCTPPHISASHHSLYFDYTHAKEHIRTCIYILVSGIVSRFMSSPFFGVMGRLTYCGYLIHPIVQLTMIYSNRTAFSLAPLRIVSFSL